MNHTLLRNDPNYTRLSGGGRSSMGRASYWLARDHLLVAEVQFVTESYRRFELRDIQAVLIREFVAFWWINLIGGATGLVCILPFLTIIGDLAAASQKKGDVFISMAIFGGLLLLLTLANWYRGSSSRLELQTSVQTISLPGLRGWRKAEQFLATLTPAIQAAQAHLPQPAEVTAQPELAPSPGDPIVPTEN